MKLSGSRYLIYDTPSPRTDRLRSSLVREGATVRVTNSIMVAMQAALGEEIDTVFVAYRADTATQMLCEQLDRLRIPKIFTGSSPQADALRIVA